LNPLSEESAANWSGIVAVKAAKSFPPVSAAASSRSASSAYQSPLPSDWKPAGSGARQAPVWSVAAPGAPPAAGGVAVAVAVAAAPRVGAAVAPAGARVAEGAAVGRAAPTGAPARSHSLIVLSQLPLARVSPSGLKA